MEQLKIIDTLETYQYAEEHRWSFIVKHVTEANDVLGVLTYKEKSEDRWSFIVL